MISWDVTASPPDASAPQILKFQRVSADHEYVSFPATPQGNWNIEGRNSPGWTSGMDHSAVWTLPEPVSLVAGTRLTFQMQFNRTAGWTDQNLGRFRLSTTANSAAVDAQRQRFGALKLADPWAKLGAAYALSDRTDEAARVIARILEQAPSSTARVNLIEQAAGNAELLAALALLRPEDRKSTRLNSSHLG